MASHMLGVKEILEELLVVLDCTQVAIYIDANGLKNLPILKKYLASAVQPIAGISKAICIEDQCCELLETIINHICYIHFLPKNEKCVIIIHKVVQKVLTKLKLYLEVAEVFRLFKEEDFNM